MIKHLRWYAEDPKRIVRAIRRRMPGTVTAGSRSRTSKTRYCGLGVLRKQYAHAADALRCFQNEIRARQLFADKPWIIPITNRGPDWFNLPLFPQDSRLDCSVRNMDEATRRRALSEAMSALLDIYVAGYLHGDFHAHNLFWYEDRLLIGDFEKLTAYPEGKQPPFRESYDLVERHKGIVVPGNPEAKPMHYSTDAAEGKSLAQTFAVPLEEALEELGHLLIEELRSVCLAFQSKGCRHEVRARRIYSSFSLSHLSVPPADAQRDSQKRLDKFGINGTHLEGASLLDLGCNIGGMIFASQQYRPAASLGVEFDLDKVNVARRVAGFNGLDTVRFRHGDVDKLSSAELGGPYDIVYCLALIKHVRQPERLCQLLGEVTGRTLYFEGNRSSNRDDITRKLINSGFSKVAYVGDCNDDCMADNNARPVFVAHK